MTEEAEVYYLCLKWSPLVGHKSFLLAGAMMRIARTDIRRILKNWEKFVRGKCLMQFPPRSLLA